MLLVRLGGLQASKSQKMRDSGLCQLGVDMPVQGRRRVC